MFRNKLFIIMLLALATQMISCGCEDSKKKEVSTEQDDNANAFSSEALADLVEYERQKEGEGTEYNPWQTYGLKEMVDMEAAYSPINLIKAISITRLINAAAIVVNPTDFVFICAT